MDEVNIKLLEYQQADEEKKLEILKARLKELLANSSIVKEIKNIL